MMNNLNPSSLLALKNRYKAETDTALSLQKQNKADGIMTAESLSSALDRLILELAAKTNLPDKVVVIATGSYGRQEMALFSDVDLWFLAAKETEEKVKNLLYPLWDMGFKVGYSIADEDSSINLCKADMTIRTALVDARRICGSEELFKSFMGKFNALKDKAFIAAKIKEQQQRHIDMGLSRYVLEPDLKQSAGALRDINFIDWIAKAAFSCKSIAELVEKAGFSEKDITRFYAAKNFLLAARIYLHEIAGRDENVLSFAYQKETACLMGYKSRLGQDAPDRLMKHFYLMARWVHYLNIGILAYLAGEDEQGLVFDGPMAVLEAMVDKSNRAKLEKYQTLKQIASFAVSAAKLKNDKRALQLLGRIITDDDNSCYVLQVLNETGFLPHICPEFAAINAKAQRDVYHIYTVDEHSLKTLGFIHDFKDGVKGGFLTGVAESVGNWKKLYWAAILHDIGKDGTLGHAERGAKIALKVLSVFNESEDVKQDTVWLIRNHLIMSKVAFHRDLSDEKTIADFAKVVGTKQRLSMLLILTAADIMAVAPFVWNDWKSSLLAELYEKSLRLIDGKNLGLRKSYKPLLEEMQALAKGSGFFVKIEPLPKETATKITVYAKDKEGLFADIVGAISMSGASIVSAKINTPENCALDVFLVQEMPNRYKPDKKQGSITDKDKIERLQNNIILVLKGELNPKQEMGKTEDKPSAKISGAKELQRRVVIDNNASEVCSVVDINAKDAKGFLFNIADTFKRLGLNIVSAHIGTYGFKVVDSFYVQEQNKEKIKTEKRLAEVQKELYKTLDTYF